MDKAEKLEQVIILQDRFEERAAILEYDAHFPRFEAEQKAAIQLGFPDAQFLKDWVERKLQEYQ